MTDPIGEQSAVPASSPHRGRSVRAVRVGPAPRSLARRRLAVAALLGCAMAAVGRVAMPWEMALLAGWDVLAAVMTGWTWIALGRLGPDETAELAAGEDPAAGWTDLLLVCASVASLGAVGLVLLKVSGGPQVSGRVTLAVVSVVLSWALVHTIFTLRYARLYYVGRDGGIDFNQEEPPAYLDFAYFSFTVGMTFQVSDTDVQTPAVRHTVLRHALVSYLFGAVIVAGTINLIAGLTR